MKKIWLVRKTDKDNNIINAQMIMYISEEKAKNKSEENNKKENTNTWDYEIFYLDDSL